MSEQINETVLNVDQRRKRAMVMRRYKEKLKRARELARSKQAPEKNIKKRAAKLARETVRERVAGERGKKYSELSTSEKIAVDKLIDTPDKVKLIRKLAQRLIPKVRRMEQERLMSFMKGHQLKNLGKPEGHHTVNEELNEAHVYIHNIFSGETIKVPAKVHDKGGYAAKVEYEHKGKKYNHWLSSTDKEYPTGKLSDSSYVRKSQMPDRTDYSDREGLHLWAHVPKDKKMNEDLNSLFNEYFASAGLPGRGAMGGPAQTSNKMIGKDKDKKKDNGKSIIQYQPFQDEKKNPKVNEALERKAEKSGIDFDILSEVYTRGLAAYPENCKVTREQYAFARVNSFINQGKTYFNEDADLQETSLNSAADLISKARAKFKDTNHPVHNDIRKLIDGINYGKYGSVKSATKSIKQHLGESHWSLFDSPSNSSGVKDGYYVSNDKTKKLIHSKNKPFSSYDTAERERDKAAENHDKKWYTPHTIHRVENGKIQHQHIFNDRHQDYEHSSKNKGSTFNLKEDTNLQELSKKTLTSYLQKTKEGTGKNYPTPLAFRKSMESQGIAKAKLGRKPRRGSLPDVKVMAGSKKSVKEDCASTENVDKLKNAINKLKAAHKNEKSHDKALGESRFYNTFHSGKAASIQNRLNKRPTEAPAKSKWKVELKLKDGSTAKHEVEGTDFHNAVMNAKETDPSREFHPLGGHKAWKLNEGKMKELSVDVKDLDNGNFKKKYGKSKEQMTFDLGKPNKSINESLEADVKSITDKNGRDAVHDILTHHGFRKVGTQYRKGNVIISRHLDSQNGKTFYHYRKFKDNTSRAMLDKEDNVYARNGDEKGIGHAINLHHKLNEELTEAKKMKGKDPCWKGYTMVGTKKKNGKDVPNCVPANESAPEIGAPIPHEKSGTKARKEIQTVPRADDNRKTTGRSTRHQEVLKKIIHEKLGNKTEDPKKREVGTDDIVATYKADTPFAEEAKSSDRKPVVIPSFTRRNDDGSTVTIPSKTVLRKSNRKIVGDGNPHDGKSQ